MHRSESNFIFLKTWNSFDVRRSKMNNGTDALLWRSQLTSHISVRGPAASTRNSSLKHKPSSLCFRIRGLVKMDAKYMSPCFECSEFHIADLPLEPLRRRAQTLAPILAKRISRLGRYWFNTGTCSHSGEGVKKIKLKNMHNKNLDDDSPVAADSVNALGWRIDYF